MTEAISQNIGKLYFEVKIVTDNLFIYTEANWYFNSNTKCMKGVSLYAKKQIGCFNLAQCGYPGCKLAWKLASIIYCMSGFFCINEEVIYYYHI